MTDDEPLYEEEPEAEVEETRDGNDRRNLIAVLTVAVVIVVIVIVLLMMRGCGSVLSNASRRSVTKQIVPVEGRVPVDGSVSVWVATGTDVQSTLSEARIRYSAIIDMGGGRFVVKVEPGTEVDAVRRLRDVSGVYDAGRVYQDDAPAP